MKIDFLPPHPNLAKWRKGFHVCGKDTEDAGDRVDSGFMVRQSQFQFQLSVWSSVFSLVEGRQDYDLSHGVGQVGKVWIRAWWSW